MKEDVLISIIISVYNSEKFFKGKIEDLLKQTILEKTEIIIVNSGSLQNEDLLLRSNFAHVKNIRYIKTDERETIYKAWNRGIKIAQGKYIINSNTDDRLKEDALEILSNELERDPNIAFVYGDQYISNIPNENFAQNKKTKKLINPNYDHLGLLSGYLAGSQPMWRSSLHFEDGIWFDESYEVAGDYDFICRVAEKYKIKKVNKFIGLYYRSDSNSNKEYQNLQITLREADIIKEKYTKNYINDASDAEIKELLNYKKIYSLIPHYIFSIYWRASKLLYSSKRVIPRYFIFYLYSLLKTRERDYRKAMISCKKYLNKNLFLIESHYEKLNKIYKTRTGLGIITCNREKLFKECISSLPNCDEIVVVNDGKPYEISYPSIITKIIQHKWNKGVSKSKNDALKYLMKQGCEHLFLMEDDIKIINNDVINHYIKTSEITGIRHLNFAYHGPANKDKDGNPAPRLILQYTPGISISLNFNLIGAFSYYRREIIENIGYFSILYKNAFEHVDHTLRVINNGLHPSFRWFVDISNSYEYIIDLDPFLKNSVIRKNARSFNLKFRFSSYIFKKKNKMHLMEIPSASEEEVRKELNNIQMKYGNIEKCRE